MKFTKAEKVMTSITVVLGSLLLLTNWNLPKADNKESTVIVPSQPVPTFQPVSTGNVTTKEVITINVKKEHLVTLIGEVRNDNSVSVAAKITALSDSKEPTVLAINSPGGSVMDGALIANAIEASKTPVYTVCLQLCASMAAIIHQYGTKRFMEDRSVLMFHDAAGGASGYIPHMLSELSTINRYIERFNAFIAHRAKMSLNDLDEMEHKQHWRDAEDSVAQNLAESVVFLKVVGEKDTEKAMTELFTGSRRSNDKKDLPQTLEMIND